VKESDKRIIICGLLFEDKEEVREFSFENEISLYKTKSKASFKTDPLHWWALHEEEFPILSNFAKSYLAIPASQASSERMFSAAKDVISDKRCLLNSEILEPLVLLHVNK